MYTSSDDADDGYYDNYISRGLCGTGPVNQQDFTIQDAVNIGLRPKCMSKGHCWICPLGFLYVPASHPWRELIQEELLVFANKRTHPIYTNLPFFVLSPMKIHAIKSLNFPGLVEEIIYILEILSMNYLPCEVKTFVKNCDTSVHQYNQQTLFGDSDSMQGFRGGSYMALRGFLEDFRLEKWEVWISRQHETVNERYFTKQDAVNMGLSPDYTSDGRGCWICPLGRLYVPASHPQKEEFHEALLNIANKGLHPIHVNLVCFELSPSKIYAIKTIKHTTENWTEYIVHLLHNISLNILPHEVETLVRNCDVTKHQYKFTLIGSSDHLYRTGHWIMNLDFFSELTATPEDWPCLLTDTQALLDELISGEDYDPLDRSQSRLEARLRKTLSHNYVNYNDYDPFDVPDHDFDDENDDDNYGTSSSVKAKSLGHQHANELQKLLDKLTAKDYPGLSDPSQQQWLESMLRKGLNAYAADNDYDPLSVFEPPQQPSKQKAPPITYDVDDPFVASPRTQQHANHHHTTCRPRRPPKFISCPNGILFRVLSHNDSKKILDTSRTDLENILLSQGQFCSRRLLQMSTVFTHDAREQALLQGPKALEFVKTLHRLYCCLSGVLNPPSHTDTSEVWTENRYTYKQQEDHLCFDCDFDNNDDDDDDIPTTAAADLLLSLIHQVQATSSPPPPTPLSQFNFSYIDVTPPRTTPSTSVDSDIVSSKPISCDKYSYDSLTQSTKRKEQKDMNDVSVVVVDSLDTVVRLVDAKVESDTDTNNDTDNDTSNDDRVTWSNHAQQRTYSDEEDPITSTYGDGDDTFDTSETLNYKIEEEMRRGTDGINCVDHHFFSPPYTLTNLQSSTIQDKRLWLEEVRLARTVSVEPDDNVTQFFQLSFVGEQCCTVLTSKQRPDTLPSSSPNPITETFIPSLCAAPSRSVPPDEAINHPYSFLSSVEVGVMIIMIMIILPTILTTILTILPMMLLLLPAVIITHEDQAVSPNTNTAFTTTVSMTIPSDATPASTFSHNPGKRKELRLQRQHFWAFIQKLHYSRIGSSGSGFQWITAILYKLSMTIWTLWQFHNDGVRSSSSAWQLLLGVLH